MSLRPTIDRESGEDHDRNGIRHVASHAACCKLVRNRAGGHGVIAADKSVLIGYDKSAAGAARLVSQCPALEPVIEHSLATVEVVQPMRSSEGLRRSEVQSQPFADFLLQGVLTVMRRSSPGLCVGGASSRLVNWRNFPASNLKNT